MYSTILVPLDGSKRAEAILPHVEELAQRFDAKVVLLQVVEPLPAIVGPEGTYIDWREEDRELQTQQAREYLDTVKEKLDKEHVDARIRVVQGPVVEGITSTAEREHADLIALASHGRSGLSRVFYGSVAAGVLHRADRPLLLIRSRHDN